MSEGTEGKFIYSCRDWHLVLKGILKPLHFIASTLEWAAKHNQPHVCAPLESQCLLILTYLLFLDCFREKGYRLYGMYSRLCYALFGKRKKVLASVLFPEVFFQKKISFKERNTQEGINPQRTIN